MIGLLRSSVVACFLFCCTSAFAVEAKNGAEAFCKGETAFGNLVTDAMRISASADIAMLACNLPQTVLELDDQLNVSASDVANTFGQAPVHFHVVQLTGENLLIELEKQLSLLPEPSNHYHQFSGIRMVVDLGMKVGNRIVKITIGGHALDLAKTYTVAVPSGNAGQFVLQNAVVSEIEKNGMMRARTYGRIKFGK
jgi:2',3'-cyclic-nucleotide 2'-phosphodiesterase (5'-nucleotidase family)